MSNTVILYNTSGTTPPNVSKLEFGELAVSYNIVSPKLYLKSDGEEIKEFMAEDMYESFLR